MNIIPSNYKRYAAFLKKYPSARKSVYVWRETVLKANWKSKKDVLNSFPNAKTLANNRARFKIEFNKYRIVAQIDYESQDLEIRFIGTHSEYDSIDPTTI